MTANFTHLIAAFGLLAAGGCLSGTSPGGSELLTDGVWQLTAIRLEGRSIAINDLREQPLIRFERHEADAQLRALGNSGCNAFGAEVEVEGNAISFLDLIATARACAPPAGEIESAYFAILTDASGFTVSDEQLRIRSGAGLLVFERTPEVLPVD